MFGITLFKEGIFYKCYNEDALVFVTRVKQYKVSATCVNNVGEAVYSVGFPVGEVEKGHLTLAHRIATMGAKVFRSILFRKTNTTYLLLDK
jgi:hypothetical protein